MANNEAHFNLCSGDLSALNLALGSGDFARAGEKARDLEACALGMGDEELAEQARALEIETYLKLRARQSRRAPAATARSASPAPVRTKDKIVRALRRKGPAR